MKIRFFELDRGNIHYLLDYFNLPYPGAIPVPWYGFAVVTEEGSFAHLGNLMDRDSYAYGAWNVPRQQWTGGEIEDLLRPAFQLVELKLVNIQLDFPSVWNGEGEPPYLERQAEDICSLSPEGEPRLPFTATYVYDGKDIFEVTVQCTLNLESGKLQVSGHELDTFHYLDDPCPPHKLKTFKKRARALVKHLEEEAECGFLSEDQDGLVHGEKIANLPDLPPGQHILDTYKDFILGIFRRIENWYAARLRKCQKDNLSAYAQAKVEHAFARTVVQALEELNLDGIFEKRELLSRVQEIVFELEHGKYPEPVDIKERISELLESAKYWEDRDLLDIIEARYSE